MKKKKVLIVAANDMGNSGVPNVYMQIIRNLSDNFVFDVLITRENYYYKNEFLSYGGKIIYIKEKHFKNKLKRIYWRLFGMKKYISKELGKVLISGNYDIVHSFKEYESWIYLKCAEKNGIKKRIIHNNRFVERSKSMLINFFIKRSIKRSIKCATDCISVSNQCGASFFQNYCYKVLWNTYDEEKFKFNEACSVDRLSLLQIGTFLPIKNQLFSLDLVFMLKSKYPNVVLYTVGNKYDVDYYNQFSKKIEELDIFKNVFVLGDQSNIPDIMKKTAFVILPSVSEGFSLVAVESQAAGLKVFASDGVPGEIDLGNINFMKLDVKLWAKEIDKNYSEGKYKRRKIDSSKFSNKRFKKNLEAIYN